MQKHLSSLFTGIMLAIFAFCLAIPTFGQADTTPEWRRRAEAEKRLNRARHETGIANTAYLASQTWYNTLADNWNETIANAPSLIVSSIPKNASGVIAANSLVSSHFPSNAVRTAEVAMLQKYETLFHLLPPRRTPRRNHR